MLLFWWLKTLSSVFGGPEALANHESLGKTRPHLRLISVLPAAGVADSCLPCSAGQLNELACVTLEMAMVSL